MKVTIWIMTIVIPMTCDLILYWAGYYGKLRLLPLSLLRIASIAIFFIIAYQNVRKWFELRSLSKVAVTALVCLIFAGYIGAMRGYYSPFMLGAKFRILSEIDRQKLQDWAIAMLRDHNTDQDEYIPTKELPSFLKIPHWPLAGANIRNRSKQRHVEIAWGSGFAGTYGIAVGPVGYFSEYDIPLMPDVYFYKSP